MTLFRLSIITASLAFYNQVWYTGGISSPAVFEFVIPPLLAFFYRPVRDRYIFMGVSFLAIISFWPLSVNGYTKDLIPANMEFSHSLFCTVFVFTIVAIFSFLFRSALVVKNEKLGNSMKQLRETTQKLVESEKMASLGVLSAGVTHEINNPLNFIKGGVEGLEIEMQKNKVNGLSFEYMDAIKEGLQRTAIIVNSLNHFSRQTDTMNESCDVHSILENCLVMIQPMIKYKGLVVKEFTKDCIKVQGNEGKLHQAFLNIISNAEQAIQADGEIVVQTRKDEGLVRVQISDTGMGISMENINKIRDPFFTTKPVGKGTGLGLAITYKIIEEHKGYIQVMSEIGKGTTFTITLPSIKS